MTESKPSSSKRDLASVLPDPHAPERPFSEIPENEQLIVKPDAKTQEDAPERAPREPTKASTDKPATRRRGPAKRAKEVADSPGTERSGNTFFARIDTDLNERVERYISNPYALYRSKADLLKFALGLALTELEPIVTKFEKVHASLKKKESK